MSSVPISAVHLLAAQGPHDGEDENASYLVTPDWTAIVVTVLFVAVAVVAVVVLVRYLRSRT